MTLYLKIGQLELTDGSKVFFFHDRLKLEVTKSRHNSLADEIRIFVNLRRGSTVDKGVAAPHESCGQQSG